MARTTNYIIIALIKKFNSDLHNLSLLRGMISCGLLRWKLEMHMTLENRQEECATFFFFLGGGGGLAGLIMKKRPQQDC